MINDSVSLLPDHAGVDPLAAVRSRVVPGDVSSSLEVARALGRTLTPPGSGSTRALWETLATLGAIDLGVARAVEPHLDAMAILAQADAAQVVGADSVWGVFAAEGGIDPLTATRSGERWTLHGTKPWCSLADRLDCALVTAHLADSNGRADDRALFAVRLTSGGVTVQPGAWRARGLAEIPSGPVEFDGVEAVPIGEPGWYLERAGFAWGGIGVAACWFGGAVGIARTVYAAAGASPDPLMAAQLGAIDTSLQAARRALAEAAALVDTSPDRTESSLLAKRVRATVARASEEVIARAAHALGPAPLALDEAHAKRVADLELYVRQHHAEKDDASLGIALAHREVSPW